MKKIKMLNCYDCNNGFLLIEAILDVKPAKIKFDRFFIIKRNDKESTPSRKLYAIQFLDGDGCRRVCDLFIIPRGPKPCRIAFFIVKGSGDLLNTPYGAYDLTEPEPLPERLLNCMEFIGMADRDKYDYYYDVDL